MKKQTGQEVYCKFCNSPFLRVIRKVRFRRGHFLEKQWDFQIIKLEITIL